MKNLIKILLCLLVFNGSIFAAGAVDNPFLGSEWDPFRLKPTEQKTLEVTTLNGLRLVGYSIEDGLRFNTHRADMKALFSNDAVLAMWGGINAQKDGPEDFEKKLVRWKQRAEAGLLSWRLFYNGAELVTVVGAHLDSGNNSPYDGGIEVCYATHPDYWNQKVTTAAVNAVIKEDMSRAWAFGKYLWATAQRGNTHSMQLLRRLGFEDWQVDLKDPALPSHMRREDRAYFKKDRPTGAEGRDGNGQAKKE